MRTAVGAALFCVSLGTGLTFFLPEIISGGAMEFREDNPFIRWGEFLACMVFAGLGLVYVIRREK